MKWYNTKIDKLPKNGQEVLISSKGINYVGTYDEAARCFLVKEKNRLRKFKSSDDQLYWTEYMRPGEKR